MPGFAVLPPGHAGEVLGRSGLVLLDFWQAACPPCRALEPRLHAFARTHSGQFAGYRVDIETDQDTPARFGVMSIPTLVWLRDGQEVARQDGLIRESDLEDALVRARGGPATGRASRRKQ